MRRFEVIRGWLVESGHRGRTIDNEILGEPRTNACNDIGWLVANCYRAQKRIMEHEDKSNHAMNAWKKIEDGWLNVPTEAHQEQRRLT